MSTGEPELKSQDKPNENRLTEVIRDRGAQRDALIKDILDAAKQAGFPDQILTPTVQSWLTFAAERAVGDALDEIPPPETPPDEMLGVSRN